MKGPRKPSGKEKAVKSGRGGKKATSKKTTKSYSKLPFSQITTTQSFKDRFPEYEIEIYKNSLKLMEWEINAQSATKLFAFIQNNVAQLLTTFMSLPVRNNESCLYPFLFDILKSIVLLNISIAVDSIFFNDPTDEEVLDSACSKVASANSSRRSSRQVLKESTLSNPESITRFAETDELEVKDTEEFEDC
jgi:hypothetical protein